MSHFAQTRAIELKVNLALWSGIVVAAGSLYHSGLRLRSGPEMLEYTLVATLLWLVHMALWMVPIQYSQETDNHFIIAYRAQIERRSGIKDGDISKPTFWKSRGWKQYKELRDKSWLLVVTEASITLWLLALVGLVLKFAH